MLLFGHRHLSSHLCPQFHRASIRFRAGSLQRPVCSTDGRPCWLLLDCLLLTESRCMPISLFPSAVGTSRQLAISNCERLPSNPIALPAHAGVLLSRGSAIVNRTCPPQLPLSVGLSRAASRLGWWRPMLASPKGISWTRFSDHFWQRYLYGPVDLAIFQSTTSSAD